MSQALGCVGSEATQAAPDAAPCWGFLSQAGAFPAQCQTLPLWSRPRAHVLCTARAASVAGPQPGSFSPVPALAHVLSEPTSGLGALPRDRGHHSDGRLGPGRRRRAWCLCSLVTVRARCSASEVWGADRAPPAPVRPPGAVLRGWRCPGSGVGSSASWLRGLGQPLVFLGCLWVGGVDFLAPGASP